MIRRPGLGMCATAAAFGLGLTLGLFWELGSAGDAAAAPAAGGAFTVAPAGGLAASATVPAGPAAGILYVAPGGQCGAAAPCYASVQAAVDAAASGDTIKVATGTYGEVESRPAPPGYAGPATIQQVAYISKTLTIRGGYTVGNWDRADPDANATILDAGGQGRVLVITGAIDPTIEGLRLTGGDAGGLRGTSWGDVGGGAYIVNAAPVLSDTLIGSNTAYAAAGLFLDHSSAILSNNTIVSNTAVADAGGLYLNTSDATLRQNTISGNAGRGWGGGVLLSTSRALLSGNTFTGNSAVHGGGVCFAWSDATLDGNLISGNRATSGGGALVYFSDALLQGNLISGNTAGMGGGLELEGRSATLINNVVADNQAGGAAGIRVVRAAPRLLHTTIARNAATGGAAGSGDGVYIENYSSSYSTVAMTNTIITDHDAGIRVLEGNAVTLNATLWQGNTTDRAGAGTIAHTNDRTGPPAFAPDGYHLTARSAAIDRGVAAGVAFDIDGDVRPHGPGDDLGADEFMGTALPPYQFFLPLVQSGGAAAAAGQPANTAPQASFTIEPAAGYVGTVFTFDASGSSDAESSLAWLSLRFDWENDGIFDMHWWNASQTREQIFEATGTRTIAMIIQDPEGLTDTTTRTLTVADPGTNTPPTARCVATPATGTVSTTFTFDASGSTDGQDSPAALRVRWDWYDSGDWYTDWLPVTQPQQWQFDRHGIKTIRVRVRDTGTLSHDTTCVVEVTPEQPNTAPTAAFTVTPTKGDVTTVFTFDASGSSDLEDSLAWLSVHFDWEDDGIYDTFWWNASQTFQHQFAAPGRYTVRMEVKDTGNLTGTAMVAVAIGAAPIYLPLLLRWP